MSSMRSAALLLAPLFVIPLLTQCGPGTAPSSNAVTGPFDSRGNYIEDWVDKPEKWYKPTDPAESTAKKEEKKEEPKEVYVQKETPPKEIAVVQPKPKPKPAPKPKPKPKPVPKTVYHTVTKGDNLTKLGRRYGVTVSAIRKANNLSGDLIMIGQRLKIPK